MIDAAKTSLTVIVFVPALIDATLYALPSSMIFGVPSIDTNASTVKVVSLARVLNIIAVLLPPVADAEAPFVLAIL